MIKFKEHCSVYEGKITFKPKDKKGLKELVIELTMTRGNKADLNDIDTSLITDMSFLFFKSAFYIT